MKAYDTQWKPSQKFPGFSERLSTMVILTPIVDGSIWYRMEQGPLKEWQYLIRPDEDVINEHLKWYKDGNILIGQSHYVRMVAPVGQEHLPDSTIWVEVLPRSVIDEYQLVAPKKVKDLLEW